MTRLLVLVATDPPVVRSTLAVALQQVRPDLDTIAVDPGALADNITRYQPDMVITSERNGTVEARVPSWVRLASDGSNAAVTSVVGIQQRIAHLHLADLVAVVDQSCCVAA